MTSIIIIVCVVTGVACRRADCEDHAESRPPGLSSQTGTRGQAMPVRM